MKQQEILKHFVANIIDIYDDTFINIFITNDKLNLMDVLKHDITKINYIFCKLWFHLFNTYPSKKHFQEFILSIKENHSFLLQNIDTLLNKIIQFEPLRIIGVSYNTLKQQYQSIVQQSSNINSITEYIIKKWQFRFDTKTNVDKNQTLLHYFIHTFQSFTRNNNINIYDILKFNPPELLFNEQDIYFLNVREMFQYLLHKNNRFLLQLANYFTIVANDDEHDNFIFINDIINVVNKDFKKHYIIINLTNVKVDTFFDYQFPSSFYNIIPKIASNCFIISYNSFKETPLCLDKQKCIFFQNNNSLSCDNILHQYYNIIFTTNIDCSNPKNHTYYVSKDIDVWKYYLSLKCPFSSYTPSNNFLIFLDYFAKYLCKNKTEIIQVINDYQPLQERIEKKHCIIIIDNRFNSMSVWSILISFYNIIINKEDKEAWYIEIYTSIDNGKLYKKCFDVLNISSQYINIIETPKLNCSLFHMELYNAFLKDEELWKSLLNKGFDKCLIVQDDGMLINKNNWKENAKLYLTFDYIGAPWLDVEGNEYIKQYINHEMVGNGGFSLRDIKKCYEITQKYKKEKNILFFNNINEIPEDVYFVKCLKSMNAKLCNFEIAKQFSIEQVVNYNSAGFHKFWMYHNPQEVFRISKHLFDS